MLPPHIYRLRGRCGQDFTWPVLLQFLQVALRLE